MREQVWSHPFLRFLLFGVLLFTILALRKPDSLTNPQFFAEDGQVFYLDQLMSGWRSVLVPYNGYLSLITRLAAAIESLFSAAFAPLVCGAIGLAVQAASYAMLILPACRYLIAPDALRVAVALVLATALDGSEMIGNTLNAQWHVILPGLVLLFLPNSPGVRGDRFQLWDGVAAFCAMFISLSVSVFVIALPIALFRAVSRTGRERLIAGTFTLGFVLQICCFVATSPTLHAGKTVPASSIPAVAVLTNTFNAWLYRVVFTTVLGKGYTVRLSQMLGTQGIWIAFLVITTGFVWLFLHAGKRQRITAAIACYFTLASLLLPLITRHLIQNFQPENKEFFSAARYFALSSYILIFAVASIFNSSIRKVPDIAKAAALCALFGNATISNFRVAPYPEMYWRLYAPAVDHWIYDHGAGLPNPEVRVPIYPAPWSIPLPQLPLPAQP